MIFARSPRLKLKLTSFALLSFAVLLSLFSCSHREPSFYLGGIQVNEDSQTKWISSLKENGYNTVAVTVYAHQGDWDSDNFWYSEKNDGVLNEIREAKKQGLEVILILRVALDHAFKRNRFLWHGMIMPKDEQALNSWFDKYRQFILTWAKIAQTEKVDILGIGSELNSMSSTIPVKAIPKLLDYYLDDKQRKLRQSQIVNQFVSNEQRLESRSKVSYSNPKQLLLDKAAVERNWALAMCLGSIDNCVENINRRRGLLDRFWRDLIRESREVFSGKLTFAANFDQFFEISFWDHLDYVGINAYFPLREFLDSKPSVEILTKGWDKVFSEIRQVQNSIPGKKPKPVIFTELGFTFRSNSTIEPWSSEGFSLLPLNTEAKNEKLVFWKEQPINYQERLAALESLSLTIKKHPNVLKGILYWKLSTYKPHAEIEPFVHILGDAQDEKFDTILNGLLN